jgi:hypothetical protein
MTVAVGARNIFKVDAGVVHALMQACEIKTQRHKFGRDETVLGDRRKSL